MSWLKKGLAKIDLYKIKIVFSWDFVDLSLEVLGLESADCKKKFVCLADNEALDNPFLQLFMQTIGYGIVYTFTVICHNLNNTSSNLKNLTIIT